MYYFLHTLVPQLMLIFTIQHNLRWPHIVYFFLKIIHISQFLLFLLYQLCFPFIFHHPVIIFHQILSNQMTTLAINVFHILL